MSIQTSEQINDLAAAMAKVQAVIEGAIKESENAAFKSGGKVSRYADLGSVWTAWQKAGPANGLAVMQFPGECQDGRLVMTTFLTHSSGQWIKSTMTIPLGKVDAHGYGSATTYGRRYALAALAGIAPEDDDGNAAAKSAPPANVVFEEAPKRTNWGGMYPNRTAMHKGVTRLIHELNGCGDLDMLDALIGTEEYKQFIIQAGEQAPHYLFGGDPAPEEFEGLFQVEARVRAECSQMLADHQHREAAE